MHTHMKTSVILTIGLMAVAASAQEPAASVTETHAGPLTTMRSLQAGNFFVPESSKAASTAPGHAHTNYVLRSLDGNRPKGATAFDEAIVTPDSLVQLAETPCSLGNLYVGSPATACIPHFTTTGGPSAAGNGGIALVDAYDNPDAASDLAMFDTQFGLPTASFVKVQATGNGSCTKVPANAEWALEESLDIEWAHVFAPTAQIILVEACSSSISDLLYAESVAFNYIVANHSSGGQVSNSWSTSEFSTEISDDPIFQDKTYNSGTNYVTHVQAFASSGDDGFGVSYPSSSPWVVAAGGSSVMRNSSDHTFNSEACWSGSGGGISEYETYQTSYTGGNVGPWANFQYALFGQANRSVPDLSFDADPASGVYVLSQYNDGWFTVGGTSVSSPSLAGIVNRASNRLSSVYVDPVNGGGFFANNENDLLYAQLATYTAYSRNFYDVKTGSNGSSATAGWDYCTGVGTVRGLLGK